MIRLKPVGTEGAAGPVVTPGGTVEGTAGLTPANCDIHNYIESRLLSLIQV